MRPGAAPSLAGAPLFGLIQRLGAVDEAEIPVFNMGMGMVVVVRPRLEPLWPGRRGHPPGRNRRTGEGQVDSSDTPHRPARIAVLIMGTAPTYRHHRTVRAGRIPNAGVPGGLQPPAAYGMGVPGRPSRSVFPLKPYRDAGKTREEYDADLADLIESYQPDWIVLAGWMHILSMAFIRRFPGKIVNLHPALPGQFPGTNSIQRAWEAYQQGQIRHTGLMVHLVPDEGVDEGPVILERCIPINPEDSVEDLEERVHRTEHEALPEALRRLVTGEVAQPS